MEPCLSLIPMRMGKSCPLQLNVAVCRASEQNTIAHGIFGPKQTATLEAEVAADTKTHAAIAVWIAPEENVEGCMHMFHQSTTGFAHEANMFHPPLERVGFWRN